MTQKNQAPKQPAQKSLSFPLDHLIPATQARQEFFVLIDNVLKKSAHYIITDRGVPKAALFPIDDALRFLDGASLAADAPHNTSLVTPKDAESKYSNRSARFPSFFVADGWRNDALASATLRDIVRSQLIVQLIERYAFPESHIIIGCSVPMSHNRFVEADVLTHDGFGHALSLFITTDMRQFEKRKTSAIDDLFALAEALRAQNQQSLRLLGYYARGKNIGTDPQEKMILINCQKYPTRRAWESARCPTLADIPNHANLLSDF